MGRATASLILCCLLVAFCNAAKSRGRQQRVQIKRTAAKGPRPAQLVQCRTEYKTQTWDGKLVQVCNSSICVGAQDMPELGRTKKTGGRVVLRQPQGSWRAFVQAVGAAEGWLVLDHISIVKALSQWQHASGVLGSVGEIGVHHGKFWMPIVAFSLASEPAVAVDLFEEQQDKNFDGSGQGSLERFLANARAQLGMRRHGSHRPTPIISPPMLPAGIDPCPCLQPLLATCPPMSHPWAQGTDRALRGRLAGAVRRGLPRRRPAALPAAQRGRRAQPGDDAARPHAGRLPAARRRRRGRGRRGHAGACRAEYLSKALPLRRCMPLVDLATLLGAGRASHALWHQTETIFDCSQLVPGTATAGIATSRTLPMRSDILSIAAAAWHQPEGVERFPWSGVPSALFTWILAQQRMAPFLWAHNKLYLTTVGAHEVRRLPRRGCSHE